MRAQLSFSSNIKTSSSLVKLPALSKWAAGPLRIFKVLAVTVARCTFCVNRPETQCDWLPDIFSHPLCSS
jgi:hypothetical protein